MSGPGHDGPAEDPPGDDRRGEPESTADPTDGDAGPTAAEPRAEERTPEASVDTDDGSAGDTADDGGTSDAIDDGNANDSTEIGGLSPTRTPFRWFFGTDNGTVVLVRDVASSVAVVALIGLLLFGVSGIWPPMVAVESGSMEPNMERGDLIFITDEERFVGDGAIGSTGVVAADGGTAAHEKFGQAGDVIVFRPDGNDFRTPVIHRAAFWVEEGENWVESQADPEYLNGATTCEEVLACPASHAGFITKGDANSGYDQVTSAGARTDVIRPGWIEGKAMFRIPWLGHVRLAFDDVLVTAPGAPLDTAAPPVATDPISPVAAADRPASPRSAPAPAGAIGAVGAVSLLTVSRRLCR